MTEHDLRGYDGERRQVKAIFDRRIGGLWEKHAESIVSDTKGIRVGLTLITPRERISFELKKLVNENESSLTVMRIPKGNPSPDGPTLQAYKPDENGVVRRTDTSIVTRIRLMTQLSHQDAQAAAIETGFRSSMSELSYNFGRKGRVSETDIEYMRSSARLLEARLAVANLTLSERVEAELEKQAREEQKRGVNRKPTGVEEILEIFGLADQAEVNSTP